MLVVVDARPTVPFATQHKSLRELALFFRWRSYSYKYKYTNDRCGFMGRLISGSQLTTSVTFFRLSSQMFTIRTSRETLQILCLIRGCRALLTAAEREVELELWRATQLAAGEAENVRASRRLLDNADTAYNIAFGRFKSGVGSILEMLSAQNALASANSSATQAEITALAARIRLSLASGRMQLAN